MSINIDKFDKDFKNNSNFWQIIGEVNRSPLLVDLINRFPGTIVLGDPGSGNFFSPDENEISIDRADVPCASDPVYLSTFVTVLGHELGHAVVPGGAAEIDPQINPMTLSEYVEANLKCEGVAILTEYRTAEELNAHMWSSGYDPNSLQKRLDYALARYGNDINNPQFVNEAIAIGAQSYVTENPSNAPHLTYEQYFAVWYVLGCGQHNYSDDEIDRIDWENIKPEDVTLKPEIAGQKREFTNSLPLLPSSALSAGFVSNSHPSAQKHQLASFASYRQDKIERARQSYEHAQNAFWASGSVLIGLRAEIEQHARANRADPGEMLASVFSSTPPPGFSRRVKEAIATSSETQTLEKDVRQAQRHLELQICRSTATPSPEAEASRGGRSLGL